MRVTRRDQRQGRGAADRLPQGLRGHVREGPAAAGGRAGRRPTPATARRPRRPGPTRTSSTPRSWTRASSERRRARASTTSSGAARAVRGGGGQAGGTTARRPRPAAGARQRDLETSSRDHVPPGDPRRAGLPVRPDGRHLRHLPRHGRGAGTAPEGLPALPGPGHRGPGPGPLLDLQPCPLCEGGGTIIEDACPTCNGSGSRPHGEAYNVNIPAGRQRGLARSGSPARARPAATAGPPATCTSSPTSRVAVFDARATTSRSRSR